MMINFELFSNGTMADILVEESAWPGVIKIADTVSKDIELVSGIRPNVVQSPAAAGETMILAATLGRSALADRLVKEGKLSDAGLTGSQGPLREVYTYRVLESPFPEAPQVKKVLCILGSDKRGTIYGMFGISEMCGVTPVVYFGDSAPAKRKEIVLSIEDAYCSKEPSVEYRGFFINDEWPAFGNWCVQHFGGVNAKMYDHIFEFILRLKGNYFWPAMWASVFSEDGPGIENARLADMYGVVMGTSHHEPLCRAGEEWKHVHAQYGDRPEWSFLSNSDAITRFWEDGLLRNREFENLITIGMRGEADSKLLPEDATMKDNVEVVKKAILAQNQLIAKHINGDLAKVPRMLAIYKEVEDYYYGDATCEGLRTWEELKDVIFLLSDDNFGHLRSLPDENDRKHPGGFGMYYHFDYHGDPISFEWLTSTPYAKIWEQMCTAYEFGVRKIWIVNVGDLKGNEYPLCYFMNLAYDFDTWGTSNPESPRQYAAQWIRRQFGAFVEDSVCDELSEVVEGYIKWSAMRRPEALRPDIYHPNHFNESQRVREGIRSLVKKAEALKACIPSECEGQFYSMIYYPAMATLNNILMNLDGGMNRWLADRGLVAANYYGTALEEDIAVDQELEKAFHLWNGEKWSSTMLSAHTCFRSWNDYDWGYPTVAKVVPIPKAKAVVSYRGFDACSMGRQWNGNPALHNSELMRTDRDTVTVDIDTRGSVGFTYTITCDKEWLRCSETKGRISAWEATGTGVIPGRNSIVLTCDRTKLCGCDAAELSIILQFENGEKDEVRLCVEAAAEMPKAAGFREKDGYISILAEHFDGAEDTAEGSWKVIPELGRLCAGVKCFPVDTDFSGQAVKPGVHYTFTAEQEGEYALDVSVLCRNPHRKGGRMQFSYRVNGGEEKCLLAAGERFSTEGRCKEWADGVLNQTRIVSDKICLKKGENHLTIYAGEPGIILERILMYPQGSSVPASYMGPEESFR